MVPKKATNVNTCGVRGRKSAMKNGSLNILTQRIRKLIDNEGGQSAFNRKTGFTRQAIGKWYNGESAPNAVALLQIAQECDCSLDWLFGLVTEDNTSTNNFIKRMSKYTGLSTVTIEKMHLCNTPNQQRIPGFETIDYSKAGAAIRFINYDFETAHKVDSNELLCGMIQSYVEGQCMTKEDEKALEVIKDINSYQLLDLDGKTVDVKFDYRLLNEITDNHVELYRQKLWERITRRLQDLISKR